ncbi:hypothetical protein HDU84_000645 [Entophlyctis sp. JEL0112]|nr:hypothetical protein HDU84_000645 [Entophlyctis sp. JEL0112]
MINAPANPQPWLWSRVVRVHLALGFVVAVCAAVYPDGLMLACVFAATFALAVLLKALRRSAHSHQLAETVDGLLPSTASDHLSELPPRPGDVGMASLKDSLPIEARGTATPQALSCLDSDAVGAHELDVDAYTLNTDTSPKKERSGKKSRSRARNDSQSIRSNASEDASVSAEAPDASGLSEFVPALTRKQMRRARRRFQAVSVDGQRMPLIPDAKEALDHENGNLSVYSESSTVDDCGLITGNASSDVGPAGCFSPSGLAEKVQSILASHELLLKEMEVLQSSNCALADYAKSITAERDSISFEYKALNALHQECDSTISSLRSNLNVEVANKVAELQSQNEALENNVATLREENAKFRAVAVSREEDWIRRMNDTEASYLRHMTNLEVKWAERSHSAEKESSSRLHDLESQLLRQSEEMEKSRQQTANEIAIAAAEIAGLHECVGAMSASYAVLARELEDSRGMVDVLESTVTALVKDLDARNLEVIQLKQKLKDLEAVNSSLSSRIASKDAEIEDMKTSISALKLELDSSEGIIKAEAMEVSRLNELVDSLQQSNRSSEAELKRYQNVISASAVIYKYEGVRSPTISPVLTGASLSEKRANPRDDGEHKVTNRPSLNVLGIPLPVIDGRMLSQQL